jgi:hypothetical protein
MSFPERFFIVVTFPEGLATLVSRPCPGDVNRRPDGVRWFEVNDQLWSPSRCTSVFGFRALRCSDRLQASCPFGAEPVSAAVARLCLPSRTHPEVLPFGPTLRRNEVRLRKNCRAVEDSEESLSLRRSVSGATGALVGLYVRQCVPFPTRRFVADCRRFDPPKRSAPPTCLQLHDAH